MNRAPARLAAGSGWADPAGGWPVGRSDWRARQRAVLGLEQRDVLPLLGAELEVQALLDRAGRRQRRARREEAGGALFQPDGDAEQVVGVLRVVVDFREEGRQLHPEPLHRLRRLDVIAAREQLHVLAFEHGQACEQRPHLLVGALHGRPLVEGAPAQLDLEGHAHGFGRGLVGAAAAVLLARRQLAAAQGAAPVRECEALADLAALVALPLHRGMGAAEVGLVALGERLAASWAEHRPSLLSGAGRCRELLQGNLRRKFPGIGGVAHARAPRLAGPRARRRAGAPAPAASGAGTSRARRWWTALCWSPVPLW